MMQLFDDIQDLSASLKDTARTAVDIRADWVTTQSIFSGGLGGNVAVQQARGPAVTAQKQGNVLSGSQWDADGIAKAITGGGDNSALVILAGVVLTVLLLVH